MRWLFSLRIGRGYFYSLFTRGSFGGATPEARLLSQWKSIGAFTCGGWPSGATRDFPRCGATAEPLELHVRVSMSPHTRGDRCRIFMAMSRLIGWGGVRRWQMREEPRLELHVETPQCCRFWYERTTFGTFGCTKYDFL